MRGDRPTAGQPDEVALGVAEERHLLGLARRTELTVGVDVDDVGLRLDRDAARTQVVGRGGDVVHRQVEDRRRCARLEQQPGRAEIEESEARRIELGDESETEDVPVERDGPLEILDVLGDLAQTPDGHGRIVGTPDGARMPEALPRLQAILDARADVLTPSSTPTVLFGAVITPWRGHRLAVAPARPATVPRPRRPVSDVVSEQRR